MPVANIHVRYNTTNGLGFTDTLRSISSIIEEAGPIVRTISRNRGQIDQIITVVAQNSNEIEKIIKALSKVANVVDVSVEKGDLQKVVQGASWVARHPYLVIAGTTALISGALLSGIYAATQLPKVFRRGS